MSIDLAIPEHVSVFDDLENFIASPNYCGLKTGPHGRGRDGLYEAWADLTPGSPCRRRFDFLLKPLPPGKWGKLLMEPRGAGKSIGAKVLSYGYVLDDNSQTITYNAQSKKMSPRAVNWVRARIMRNQRYLVDRRSWGSSEFTVVRDEDVGDNPTMSAGSPDADVTGARPAKQILDDIVCDKNNATLLLRQGIIEWWERLQDQFSPATEVLAIGTRYPEHNLWEEIMEQYAKYFEIMLVDCYDDNMNAWYPWMTPEYLQRQEEKNPQRFRMQFRNQKVASEDCIFHEGMITPGDPPMIEDNAIEGGKRVDPRLNVYMLTDTAQSASEDACETCFLVIAKDWDDNRWILDADIGRWEANVVQDRFLRMYKKWIPHGLIYATMEMRGTSRSYVRTIPQLARLDPQYDFVPKIIEIPRSSREDKDSRISVMLAPFKEGKFRFSTYWLPVKTFFIDHRGRPAGILADRIMSYSPHGDGLKDVVDCLSDDLALVGEGKKRGPACPPPSRLREQRKVLTDAEWAKKKALKRLGPRVIYM